MRRLIFTCLFVLWLAISAHATQINIGSLTVPNARGYTGTVKLRIYFTGCSGSNFKTNDNLIIQCGTVGSATGFYNEIAVIVSGNDLVLPAYTLPSTDNSSQPNVRATGVFFVNNARREDLFTNWTITASLGTNVTFAQLYDYQPKVVTPPFASSYLTAEQVAALINTSIGTLNDASDVVKGRTKLNVAPQTPSEPVATGTNWGRLNAIPVDVSEYNDNLNTAVTSIGAITNVTLAISRATTVTSNVTVTPNIELKFKNGGYLDVTTGVTVIIQGAIIASPLKVFYNALAGQGAVSFSGNVTLRGAFVEWWGTGGGATTAATTAAATMGAAPIFTTNTLDPLAGTSGTPSSSNKYVTDSDPRLSGLSTKWVYANTLPGANICAKVNAAVTLLDGVGGTIFADGGGDCATTQIRVKANMRLILGAGTYFSQLPNYTGLGTVGALVLMDSDSSVEGTGWHTILKESSVSGGDAEAWKVVMSYAGAAGNGGTSRNIRISNFQVQRGKPTFNSSGGTIDLGNCHSCLATGLFLNGTSTIGLHAGGASAFGTDPGPDLAARGVVTPLGRYSENISFTDNLLFMVASQNIAFVNTQNSNISRNRIITPGQPGGPGVAPIDLEPNVPTDRMTDITIEDNVIDTTIPSGTSVFNAILVQQSGGVTLFGPIVVQNNRIIGAALSNASGNGILTSSIYALASNVHVLNNFIQRGYDCIKFEGSVGGSIKGNTLTGCGFTSNSSIHLLNSTGVTVSDNTLLMEPQDALVGADRSIVESGTSNSNFFTNNLSNTVTVVGAASRLAMNTTTTGAVNFGAPSGIAPLTVNSGTLKVTNLDVDKVDGGDWIAPGNIGTGTPATAIFTTLTANTSLTVNAGTALTKILSASASLDYAQAGAGACETLTITVTGVADDGTWALGVNAPHALMNHNTTATLSQWVSAGNTVSVRRCVISADGSNPAAATVRVDARKY